MSRITFYTRRDCHLCDSARYVLDRALTDRPDVRIEVIDIDADPELVRRYGHDVPVILLDGREFARHRLDETALRRALCIAE